MFDKYHEVKTLTRDYFMLSYSQPILIQFRLGLTLHYTKAGLCLGFWVNNFTKFQVQYTTHTLQAMEIRTHIFGLTLEQFVFGLFLKLWYIS